jgi:fructose/tagatose bisphosphate aldolase
MHEAVHYGVVKMNINTDAQYAFTRAIADRLFKNYDGVLKVDGESARGAGCQVEFQRDRRRCASE